MANKFYLDYIFDIKTKSYRPEGMEAIKALKVNVDSI